MAKSSNKATAKYNLKAYDRLEIKVPKGSRKAIQQAADEAGESMNAYVGKAIQDRMGIEDWPKRDEA